MKPERYSSVSGAAELDPREDTPVLEAELLKGVTGPFMPYSRKDLEAIAERVRVEKMQRSD